MGYRYSVLSNGIRVVTEEIPYVRSVSLGLWVAAGSRCETASEQGVSHFIEHMLFKGTERRSARSIAEEFDSVGGQVNAFTSREYTCYYAKVLDTHLDLSLEILADMFLNSKITAEDVEKEKGVVLEEVKLYEDTPEELVNDLSAQAVFGDHPLGTNVLGTVDTVPLFSPESIREYMSRWYVPSELVVAAAGNLSHDELVAAAEAALGGSLGADPRSPVPSKSRAPVMLTRQKDIEQVHLCLCGPGAPRNHHDKMPLLVLETVLGGGMSSRLFQELREERGLVYSAYSYHTSFQDTGVLSICAAMSPDNVQAVCQVVQDELRILRDGGVTEVELQRAKEQLKGNLVLGLESTSNRQSRLGKMELFYDRLYSAEEVLVHIQEITKDQVDAVCRRSLAEDTLSGAIVGPQSEDEIRLALEGFMMPIATT